jgi:hypothetical protein
MSLQDISRTDEMTPAITGSRLTQKEIDRAEGLLALESANVDARWMTEAAT